MSCKTILPALFLTVIVVLLNGDVAMTPPSAPHAQFARVPLRFEANDGQWDERARFRATAGATTLVVMDDGSAITLSDHLVTIRLSGAKPVRPRGETELPTKSNFFLGADPSKWRTNVTNYERVRAHDVLSGVDMVWHGDGGTIEYDLEVAAGVDATTLALAIDGADSLAVAADGSLVIQTNAGTLTQPPPRVVQSGRTLPARYVIPSPLRVGFVFDGYDARSALLIDPLLTYSTYLGGYAHDEALAIAADASGNAYITGITQSANFPTQSPLQASAAGNTEAFVAKLNSTGSALVYSTYFGGAGTDYGLAIAVDGSGNAYITGETASTDFPTKNPFQSANGGGGTFDAFVTKLNATGSALLYSTYLGGSSADDAHAIAIDTSGNAYVAGMTVSTNFPTLGAFQSSFGGYYDVFVTKLNSAGSALVYSTYLGGSDIDWAYGVAVDGSGNAYISGETASSNLPTQNAFQGTYGGSQRDAFVTKLNTAGSALVYSTYLGGSNNEGGTSIAVDGSGNAYVAGYTVSTDFPTKSALQPTINGASDAFVAKFNAAGSALVYSTYLGSDSWDSANGIGVDGSGNVWITGTTQSNYFPTKSPLQSARGGLSDAFVTELSSTGSAFVYSSYLGGSGNDEGWALYVGKSGKVYVAGGTGSPNFPTQNPFQSTMGGGSSDHDAFITTMVDPIQQGGSCESDGDCISKHCVDGVCCESACSDQCAACDMAGNLGKCSPVTGAPHGARSACGGTGVCEGACDGKITNVCTYAGAATACDSVCKNSVQTDSACDGKGNCIASDSVSCKNVTCAADGKKCKPSCASDADCAGGFICSGGACTPPGSSDAGTSPPDSGGCSCSTSDNEPPYQPMLIASVVMALAACVRRRRTRQRARVAMAIR